MQPDVYNLMDFIEGGPQPATVNQGITALEVASAMVLAYTRGAGKDHTGNWREGVGEVVLSLAARILGNPSGVSWRNQAGSFSQHRGEGVKGFTLAEQYILNRYRKRAI